VSRAKMQVLVIPYIENEDGIKYCIFNRSDTEANEDFWQFVAGGGEDDEKPLETAKRETWEETGMKENVMFYQLESLSYVPTSCFSIERRRLWGMDCLVIPEYKFAVCIKDNNIQISNEHKDYRWVDYDTAIELLKFESNKIALWELDSKIKMKLLS
jgi:NTP pyrophosphohydrolases including oxidative damage repair enzymes